MQTDTQNTEPETVQSPAVSLTELGASACSPLGVEDETVRGWEVISFQDEYGEQCSIQISSRAVCENEDGSVDDPLGWLWLGLDDAKPMIMKRDARDMGLPLPPGEVTGWMDYAIPAQVQIKTRMHLNERQVRGLIARLQHWLKTGQLHQARGCATEANVRAARRDSRVVWSDEHGTEFVPTPLAVPMSPGERAQRARGAASAGTERTPTESL